MSSSTTPQVSFTVPPQEFAVPDHKRRTRAPLTEEQKSRRRELYAIKKLSEIAKASQAQQQPPVVQASVVVEQPKQKKQRGRPRKQVSSGEPVVVTATIGAEMKSPMETDITSRRVQREPNMLNRIPTSNTPPSTAEENEKYQKEAQRHAEAFWATVAVVKEAMSQNGPLAGLKVKVTNDAEGDMIMQFEQSK